LARAARLVLDDDVTVGQILVMAAQGVGFEARWCEEVPAFIEAIGAWVLDEACGQLARWRAQGLGPRRIGVNVSAHQLRSTQLTAHVQACLTRHGLPAEVLVLELTESAAMAQPETSIRCLQSLRALGVSLSIDDFGTGYSSLAYLKLLPIQSLKLDRSFVRDIEHSENDAAISAATLALAHTLGLHAVAEGVETQAEAEVVQLLGIAYVQGFRYRKPGPIEEFRPEIVG